MTAESIKSNHTKATIFGWTVFLVFIVGITLICTVFAQSMAKDRLESSMSELVRANPGEFTYEYIGRTEVKPMALMSENDKKSLSNLQKSLYFTSSLGANKLYSVKTEYNTFIVMVDGQKGIALTAQKQ
jgi:hypothetical protein